MIDRSDNHTVNVRPAKALSPEGAEVAYHGFAFILDGEYKLRPRPARFGTGGRRILWLG